jgi:hypothetical protein
MRTGLAIALSALAAAVVAVAACSSTPVLTTGSTFSAPYSIAVTWGPDRDLLFIANASGDDLTAMSICTQVTDATSPTGFRSGSTGLPVANTCLPREDQELLPGPIRVFPGSITAGDRPSRLAGARLLKLNSDGTSSSFGAVLVAGLAVTAAGRDPLIRVIDANNILAASQRTPPTPVHPPFDVALPAPAVDVVASEVPGQRVRAFVVSQAPAGAAILTAFDVSAQDSGPVLLPAARCTLDLVATRLALVPGTDDLLPNGVPAHVYVADGTPDGVPGGRGDGAVEVSVAAMPPYDPATFTACPAVRRLPASDPTDVPRVARPLRSIALSPSFFQAKSRDSDPNPITPIPARGGAILLGVTLGSSALCGLPGVPTCGEGSIVIVQTNPAGTPRVAPAPPVDFFAVPAGAQAMAPLHALSGAREITFLRPIPGCPNGANACVDITAGLSTRLTSFQIQLGAAASTDDGGTVLINVIDRRFVDDLRDERINNAPDPNAALPPALSSVTFFPSPPIGQAAPQLLVPNVIPAPAGDPFSTLTGLAHPCPDINTPACLNKGATTPLRWAVIWHGVMPGLESVAGTLHRDTDTGPVRLELPARDLNPWITSPRLALQAGDVVHIRAVANPAALCSQLAAIPGTQDLLIKAVERHALVLEPAGRLLAAPFSTILPFDFPASCGAVGVAVDVRTGSTTRGEWLVTAGTDVRGRVNQGKLFVSTAQRFDNPIDVPAPRPQQDIEVAFVPFGALPTFSGQQFIFTTARGTQPTTIRETNVVPQGPSGDVFAYQSGHFSGSGIIAPNLLFTSLTGNNALVRSSPANIGSQTALVVYR